MDFPCRPGNLSSICEMHLKMERNNRLHNVSSDLHMRAIECAAKHVHSVHSIINKWILLKFEYSKPSKFLSKSNGTVN